MDPKLSLAGLLIGLLVGVTGMGGGSLMTPMLVLLFGFKPSLAIGTDILHGAIFKTFGGVQHWRLGHVNLKLSGWMLLGSAPFSLGGVALATWLKHRYGDGFEHAGEIILGAALVICGLGFLIKAYLRHHTAPDWVMSWRDKRLALVTGMIGGFVVGLTSVGSGTFFGLVMLVAFPLAAAQVVGTDIFHAAALLWVAGIGHLIGGNVDLTATGWLLIGSIPGVLIGSHLVVRLPDRGLRVALAATLTLAGIKLLDVPGADGIIVGVAACLAVFGLVVAVRTVVRRTVAARAEAEPEGG
ncbi:MAG: sulfite exporter TauE/SafE family protein [Actinomycetota bacterium]